MNAQGLVAKVWNFALVLRGQGVAYRAYISQISYLLFQDGRGARRPDWSGLHAAWT